MVHNQLEDQAASNGAGRGGVTDDAHDTILGQVELDGTIGGSIGSNHYLLYSRVQPRSCPSRVPALLAERGQLPTGPDQRQRSRPLGSTQDNVEHVDLAQPPLPERTSGQHGSTSDFGQVHRSLFGGGVRLLVGQGQRPFEAGDLGGESPGRGPAPTPSRSPAGPPVRDGQQRRQDSQ